MLLRLSNTVLGPDGTKVIADALTQNSTLIKLQCVAFCTVVFMAVEVFCVYSARSNGIGVVGAAALAAMLQANSTLQVLWCVPAWRPSTHLLELCCYSIYVNVY